MSKTIRQNAPKRNRRKTASSQRRRVGPGVTVRADGYRMDFPAADMADPANANRVAAFCCEADENPRIVIRDLPAWPDEARWFMLQTIAQLERPHEIRMGNDGQPFDDLFAAVLDIAEGPANIERSGNCRRAAIEAAALKHPNGLDTACQQIMERFRQAGHRGLRMETLLQQARNILGAENESADPAHLADNFHNHVCSETNAAGGSALRYFQEDFFVWQGDRYCRTPTREFEARLAKFLQSDNSKLTSRSVQDVLTNLRGKVLVQGWQQQRLPLWICDESGGTAEPSPFIAFANGRASRDDLLDFEADELTLDPHDSRNFSEVVLPYDYDCEAECPLWEETLEMIFPSLNDTDRRIQVLQEFVGYSLIEHDTTFEKFLILSGEGGNGKSTILKVLQHLLGPENVSHLPLEAFGSEFRLSEMQGKLANIAADMNWLDKVQEGLLKSLTSGDPIQVNRKNKEPITMRPTARLYFATNTLPPISDRSQGIWRRMIPMPFYEKFGIERRDRERANKLLSELSGIFNWALEGARRLYEQDRFSECSVCRAFLDDYQFDADPFRQFVEECLELDAAAEMTKQDAYERYDKFCEDNGRCKKHSSDFGKRMRALPGVEAGRQGSGQRLYFFRGVRLRKPPKLIKPPAE